MKAKAKAKVKAKVKLKVQAKVKATVTARVKPKIKTKLKAKSGLGIRSFAHFAQIKLATVSNSLRSLKTNE